MKTLALTIAATLIASTSAFAGNTSFSTGDGFVRIHSPAQMLDNEATASIGSASNQVHSGTQFFGGREANIRYTIGADGEKNIISKSFRSSGR